MAQLWNLIKLFWLFFKIGLFTFGGGYAMMPLMQEQFVHQKKWLTEAEIADYFAISNSLPGVIAINSSIFIGKKVAGFSGAIMAALGITLPAFLSIILILTILQGLEHNLLVEKFFIGIRAASTALIFLVTLNFAQTMLQKKSDLLLAVIGLLAIAVFHVNAIWVIVGAGVVGYWRNRRS